MSCTASSDKQDIIINISELVSWLYKRTTPVWIEDGRQASRLRTHLSDNKGRLLQV